MTKATFSPLCGNHVRQFIKEHMEYYLRRHVADNFGYEDCLIEKANEMADASDDYVGLAWRMNLPVTSAIAGAILMEREECKRAYVEWSKKNSITV